LGPGLLSYPAGLFVRVCVLVAVFLSTETLLHRCLLHERPSKPHESIVGGAMYITKPCKLRWFGVIHGHTPHKFKGFRLAFIRSWPLVGIQIFVSRGVWGAAAPRGVRNSIYDAFRGQMPGMYPMLCNSASVPEIGLPGRNPARKTDFRPGTVAQHRVSHKHRYCFLHVCRRLRARACEYVCR
jgi:hypothetical protein